MYYTKANVDLNTLARSLNSKSTRIKRRPRKKRRKSKKRIKKGKKSIQVHTYLYSLEKKCDERAF